MKTNRLRLVVYVISTLLFVGFISSNKKEETINVLNKHIIELPNESPLLYSDQLIKKLHGWENYSVIGLGEAAHGAREFFELKHRLFKYFVENENFKLLAYEFSYRTSIKINNYITKGIGDIDSLFAGELWIQDNYEVQDLIAWMRHYNEDKPVNEQIQFIGIDNQLDAFNPEKTIDCIYSIYPEIITSNKALINNIKELEYIRYTKITTLEYSRRKELYTQFKKAAVNYFEEKNELTDTLNQKITIHLIESLINSNQWLYNIYTGKMNNRDYDMANNLLWAKECYNSKVAIWAHSSHVQNNPFYDDKGGKSMGYYLKELLKDEYLMVSTAFSKGKFKAVMTGGDGKDTSPLDCEIKDNPLSGSINEILYQAKYENLFLNVNEINPNSQLYSYLDTIRSYLGVGDWFEGSTEFHYVSATRKINLLRATDLIFYFSETHPIRVHKRFK